MAIQSASAKLYTGIRCYCVDKNISAALTAPFSLGNKDIDFPGDVPVLDANGIDTIYPNVYAWRIKRTYIDLFPVATISLTNQRYRTYGGGNVINDGFFVSGQSYKILELGDSDWDSIAGTGVITAGNFVIGVQYKIISVGSTNFTAVGAANNNVNTIFVATGVGTGTGTVKVNYQIGTEFIAANNGALPEVAGAANDENAETPNLSNASRKTGKVSLSSWTARSTLVCDFPTYIRIDIEKLGIPEGTDCIVQFEENWIVEDRGRVLPSGTYEYPNNIQNLGIPRNDNYVQFRTPWFGLSFLTSVFNYVVSAIKYRPFSSVMTNAFTPVMTANITRRGVLDLQSAFITSAIIGFKKFFAVQMVSIFEPNEPGGLSFLIGNGYEYPPGDPFAYLNAPPPWQFPGVLRIRNTSIQLSQIVSTLSLPEFLVVLEMAAITNSNFTFSSDAFKYKGVVNLQFNSTTTQSSVANRTASGVSTMTSSTSVSLPLIRRTKQFSANLSSPQASVFCDANSPMILVFNTSLNRLNYSFGSEERTSVAGRTVMFSIGKFYQDYQDYQALGLRNKSASITVDWGDGTSSSHSNSLTIANLNVTTGGSGDIQSTGSQAEVWHTYATPGIYEVKIYGTMKHFGGDLGSNPYLAVQDGNYQADIGPGEALIGCKTFGQQAGLTNISGAFNGCPNLQYYPDMIPTTITRLETVFLGAGTLVSGGPVGYSGSSGAANWNTTNVITMAWMFRQANMNPDISGWNVANVAPTAYTINDGFRAMFFNNTVFNRNLSGWCVNDFATLPSGFDTGATAWVLPRPVWGTCP